ALDLATQVPEQARQAQKFVAVVDLGNVEPAVLRIDAGRAIGAYGVADIVEPGLGQRPQRLGALEPNPRDQLFGVGGKTRKHKTGIAARRARGDAAALQKHDRPAGPSHLARSRQTCKPPADHANIDVEVDGETGPPRFVRHRGGVPTLAVSCGIGVAHSVAVPVLRLRRGMFLSDFAASRNVKSTALDSPRPESD